MNNDVQGHLLQHSNGRRKIHTDSSTAIKMTDVSDNKLCLDMEQYYKMGIGGVNSRTLDISPKQLQSTILKCIYRVSVHIKTLKSVIVHKGN